MGPRRAAQLLRRATFVISAGTTDLFSHYLATNRSGTDSWPQYENLLITRVTNNTTVSICQMIVYCLLYVSSVMWPNPYHFTQVMRALGGRRFVFVGVPPVGCLPLVRTLLGMGAQTCHEDMNSMATSFNRRLAEVVHFLRNQRDIRATFIDVYPIISMATIDPKTFGKSWYILVPFKWTEGKKKCTLTGSFDNVFL